MQIPIKQAFITEEADEEQGKTEINAESNPNIAAIAGKKYCQRHAYRVIYNGKTAKQ